jgi:predicted phosphodiesterase
MTVLEDLLNSGGEFTNARKPRMNHPTGWEPGINTESGRICVQSEDNPNEVHIDWSSWLEHFGFSGDHFTILDDTVEVRSWDANMGGGVASRFYYYKAKIVRKHENALDYDDLVKYITKFKPRKRPLPTGTKSYVIALADLQIGKKDGDGLKGVVARMLQAEHDIVQDIRQARKEGHDIGQIILAGLGDIIEGCDGHYKMQTFQVELDRREQVKVARRLLLRLVRAVADETDKLLILSVPGNHGENRKGGKAYTTFGDNDDVAVFEQLSDILKENPDRYGHVKFVTPYNDLSVTIDIDGTVIGFIHGHQARTSGRDGLAHTKIWSWWKNQSHESTPIGTADILVSGHFHYYSAIKNGTRTHFQAPPLDSESQWFYESYGYGTQPGILTFLVDGSGWERQNILTFESV